MIPSLRKYFLGLFLLVLCSFGFAQNRVSATIDLNALRAVEGTSKFDRDIFINLHGGQGDNDWTPAELDDMVNRLGINFGRSVGGVTWQMNRLRENPNRPGFFDLDHMKELGQSGISWYKSRTALHPYESSTFVTTSHISPLFPNGKATNQGWVPANYAAVGQFYAYLMKEYYGNGGEPRPKYVEVINEPFVHANELNTTNAEISTFHNVVADSIRAHTPDVMVGGYTAAWPEFERNNFGIWDGTWRTFIDIAGANMDFYSFHLYDTPKETNGAFRKGSNVEAIFDMIEQYSLLKIGEMKPVVISEYGGCCADWDGPYYEARDWQQLKSLTSITLSLMERPHQILKAIPFITGKATWYSNNTGYPYPHVLLKPGNGGTWEYTHLAKYYALWSAVNGNRVGSQASDLDLQIDAYVDENKAYVILHNLESEDQIIDLKLIERNGAAIIDTRIKHLFAINDIPQLTDEVVNYRPNSIVLGADASMVLEYTYASPLVIDKQQDEQKFFADSYLKNITANTDLSFKIDGVQKGEFGTAILRLSLGRSHNRSLQPEVTLNGTTLAVPTDWRGYDQKTRQDFFGTIDIPVSLDLIKNNNEANVRFGDSGGHVSTVVLQLSQYDYDPADLSVAVNEPAFAHEFKVFPNPVKAEAHFKWTENLQVTDLRLLHLNGQLLQRIPITGPLTSADLSELAKGMYLVQVQTVDGRFSRKLILL